jgi:hypothetical protein
LDAAATTRNPNQTQQQTRPKRSPQREHIAP